MKLTIRKLAGIALLAAMPLVATNAMAAGQWWTPEYAKGEYRPRSMVIIPPLAEVMLKKVASTEQMVEESALLEDATALVLREQIEGLGYEVRVLTVDEVNGDPILQGLIRALNERYDDEMSKLRTKAKDIRERRYTYGEEAMVVADHLGAEALVMARVYAEGASGGQKTMAVLFGGSMGGTDISVGIIAGDNGDLEAFYQQLITNVSPEQLSGDPEGIMRKVTKKVIKKFPAVDAQAKWNKRWPQSTNRVVPEPLPEGDEALADLEALFGDVPEAQQDPAGEQAPEDEQTAGEAAAEEPDEDR